MLTNLVKFIIVTVILAIAALFILMVGGALDSDQLRDNIVKILEIAAIVLVASAAVLFATNKK